MHTFYADCFPFSDQGLAEVSTVRSAYLHGQLETKASYDMVTQAGLSGELTLPLGIIPVRVCFDFGDDVEAIAFVWLNEVKQKICVIVRPTDIKAILYAWDKLENKPLTV